VNVRTAARIRPKSPAELAKMREAGRIVGEVLAAVAERIKPGATALELDDFAETHIRRRGAVPSFKGYHGFPRSLCISINEEVVHGIPGRRALRDGDLVTIDCGANLDGWHGDAARTFSVGRVDAESLELMRVCEGALMAGVAEMRPRRRLADVSKAVEGYVKRESSFSVVRQYVGHGIGRALHEEPQVPNYFEPGFPFGELVLEPGHVFAIEPMVNAGTHDVRQLEDLWTVVTADGRRSAHFEHTVAVTEDGPQLLTLP
jgi:methionyl aminopeptidase